MGQSYTMFFNQFISDSSLPCSLTLSFIWHISTYWYSKRFAVTSTSTHSHTKTHTHSHTSEMHWEQPGVQRLAQGQPALPTEPKPPQFPMICVYIKGCRLHTSNLLGSPFTNSFHCALLFIHVICSNQITLHLLSEEANHCLISILKQH